MCAFLHYDEPLYRPPSEAESIIIQVTIGCSNNQCAFCEMYTAKKFRVRSAEEISKDIEAAARLWHDPQKIFLADGDALVLPAKKLLNICELLHKHFSHKPRISTYATPNNLLVKSPKDLKDIQSAGISLLYIGVESGSDLVLDRVHKGATAKEIETAIIKAREAEFETSVTWILGLGGKKYSHEHTRETAKVISRCGPTYTSALTLMLPNGEDRIKKHFPEWEVISPVETLQELKIFAQNYNGSPTIFRSNHASNYLPIKATLPNDRDKLITLLDKAMKNPEEFLRPEWSRGL